MYVYVYSTQVEQDIHTHVPRAEIILHKSQHQCLEVLVYNQLISFFIKSLENCLHRLYIWMHLKHSMGEMTMIHDLCFIKYNLIQNSTEGIMNIQQSEFGKNHRLKIGSEISCYEQTYLFTEIQNLFLMDLGEGKKRD